MDFNINLMYYVMEITKAEKRLLAYVLEDEKEQLSLQTIVKIVIVISPMLRIPVKYSVLHVAQ